MAPLLFLIATGLGGPRRRAPSSSAAARDPTRGPAVRPRVPGPRGAPDGRASSTPTRPRRSTSIARTLILVALAAVGMSIHVGELRETSWRPLAVGFAVALVVGLGSLVAIMTLGLGSGHRGLTAGPRDGRSGGRPAIVRSWRSRRWSPGGAGRPRSRGRSPHRGSDGSTIARRCALQKRLVAERADGRIGDRLLLLEHPAGPDPRPHRRPGAHPRDPGDARRARHRGRPRRARRRGDLSRPGPAGGLSDPRALAARPAGPAARPRARGGADRDLRRARRRRPPGATAIPAAGATPMAPTRARSARSGCASSAA